MSADWQAFWTSWRMDLDLTVLVLLTFLIYFRGWLRLRRRGAAMFGPWQLAALGGGLLAVWFALQSPLEPFSALLLQVHMVQHLLLMFAAPPLLWLANPELPLLVGLPRWLRRSCAVPLLRDPGVRTIGAALVNPVVAWLLFVVVAWVWHLPQLYELALGSEFWHQIEHASFFFAALCFWRVVIAPYPSRMRLDRWVVLPYLLLAGLQGTALSALLTFSDRVVYAHYRSVPRLWNITALDDQAVAGALMWACGSLVYLVALSLVVVKIWNEPAEPQWAGNAGAGPLPRGLDAFGRGSRKRLARIRKLERRSERTTSPPAPRRWDLLQLPLLGTVMRSLTTRRVLQAGLFALAALIVIDGLLGPQVSPVNLAGVLPWIHWRGLLVIVLLVAGNFFCMACPFTLPRTIAKKIFRGNLQWPEFLRNKWLAIGLLILFFWAYEALALWDSPWWTAWIVVGYFAASFAIDGLFRGAAFCKYVCPIGQFNFVTSLVSPLQVAVRDISSCTTCETKDCIRGGPLGPGCQTDLFAPQKASNLDCTFCLDCVRSCPRDNVGLLAFVPTNQLTRAAQSDSSRQLLAGAAWWRRTDIAALLLVLASAAFVNAAWMVAPVVQLEQETMSYFVSAVRPLLVGLGMLITLCGVPALAMFVCSASSRGLGGSRLDLLPIAKRYTPALVPLAVAMWAAHYAFHLLSSAGTLLAAGNRLLADWKLVPLSEAAAACACCGEAAGWILPLEILLLDVGLCGSLLVAYRVAQTDAASTAVALRAFAPWGVLLLGLFALGVWILLQPMQMRGTLVLGV